MEIAVVVEGISETYLKRQPWNYYSKNLAKKNINIHTFLQK